MTSNRSFRFFLTRHPAMVRVARRRVLTRLQAWGEPLDGDVRDRVALVVSELVTNAIRHTDGERVGVHTTLARHRLRLGVHDASVAPPREPDPHSAGETTEGGRGMLLVSLIADRYGHTRTARGKVVWAEFDLPVNQAGSRHALLPAGLPEHATVAPGGERTLDHLADGGLQRTEAPSQAASAPARVCG